MSPRVNVELRSIENEEQLRELLHELNDSGVEPVLSGADRSGAFIVYFLDGEGPLDIAFVRGAEDLDAHDDEAEHTCTPAWRLGEKDFGLYWPLVVLLADFEKEDSES